MKKKKRNPPKTKVFRRAIIKKRRARVVIIEPKELVHRPRIRVVGIGGGGSSVVSEIAPRVKKVDFVVANTDKQALKTVGRGARTLIFGERFTAGLGCGMDVRVGQKAAREEKQKISKLFKGIDLCVLVSSLGGGAGSGASPEFAKIARDLGVMTFGIFTLPFRFEGGKRAQIARSALDKLTPNLNAFSIIPNENIFQIIDKKTPIKEAFSAINRRLAENLQGLIEMIYLPGLINIDFADLKTILEGRGKLAYLNSAITQGENRVEEAIKTVLSSPLNEYGILGAEKIIFNITASRGLGMKEVEEIAQAISAFNKRAKIIFGISQNDKYKDKIRISLLAVGCGKEEKPRPPLRPRGASEALSTKLSGKPQSKKKRKIKKRPPQKKRKKIKIKPKIKIKKKSPRPAAKIKRKKKPSKPIKIEVIKEETPQIKTPTRRSALDLKKATEKTEQEMLDQEKKWDLPAFLRRKPQESK